VLLDALGRPQPLLAHARSPFEVRLVIVCELTGMRAPDALNVKIAGYTVDAVWWDEKVVVECDGEGNHGTWRQRRRDVGEEIALRHLGFVPIRYTTDKLDDPWVVYADLGAELAQRRGLGGLPLAS
jgi:very-short-patch-repair endonuclease